MLWQVDVDSATDTELLDGCRAGQEESWDGLVRRYERLVYSVALRCGLRPADATDVVQSTFVALLKALPNFRDAERLAAWLVTVTRRQAWRLLSRSTQEVPFAALPDQPIEQLAWEDAAALHEALSRLGPACRDLLFALYFDPSQPSYQQIAERLERAPGGVGPLRGRCLEQLRALLEVEDR